MLSLGSLVLPLPVGLLMVSPLPLPMGLVPVMGVDRGGGGEEGRGGEGAGGADVEEVHRPKTKCLQYL